MDLVQRIILKSILLGEKVLQGKSNYGVSVVSEFDSETERK